MFRMTSHIVVGDFKPFKASKFNWEKSIDNYSDTASIFVPAITRLKKEGDQYEKIETGLLFKEGMKVSIAAGYDGDNIQRFTGFVRRVIMSVPLELVCEGYAYQLRTLYGYTRTFINTTVKAILEDLIKGTDIVLSEYVPDIPLDKVQFSNVTGIEVLEWLKEKCLLTIYFNGNELYCGMQQLEPKVTKRFRLNWNTIKDSGLTFETDRELADVKVEVENRSEDGSKDIQVVGSGKVKRLKSAITDSAVRKKIAAQKRIELQNRGYEGDINAFLEPYCEPGMATQIEDRKYPERTGKYFVQGVSGSFSKSGGRQTIQLGANIG